MKTKKVVDSSLCCWLGPHSLPRSCVVHQEDAPEVVVDLDNVVITASEVWYQGIQLVIHQICLV